MNNGANAAVAFTVNDGPLLCGWLIFQLPSEAIESVKLKQYNECDLMIFR